MGSLAVDMSFADSYHREPKQDDYIILPNKFDRDDYTKEVGGSGTAEIFLPSDSSTISGQEQRETNNFIISKEKEFKFEITHALIEESIEDGYIHPAENIIQETIRSYFPFASSWIQSLYIENLNNHNLAAGILRCIGRLNSNMTKPWGSIMVTGALFHPNVEVREAAVRAVEMWEDYSIIEYLERREEKVLWLADYIRQVIKDLKR